jgi:hypothetical protein
MVGKLILKVRLACSLPALNVEEFAAMTEAWCELLGPVIPPERLNDCYLSAMQTRDSTFPLAATEMLTAWRRINSEEATRRQRARPCFLCQGRRFELIYDPKTDTEIEKECPVCFGKVSTALEKSN